MLGGASSPLTEFLIALTDMTSDQLAQASADRAAARYGIRLDLAVGYIALQRRCLATPIRPSAPAQGRLF